MSRDRMNIVWQSEDGSWNIGFYANYPINSDSDDYDDEWDVEYDFDEFEWASTGHRDAESARRSWRGVNPGGSQETTFARNPEAVVQYDRMAKFYLDPAFKAAELKKENDEKNEAHFANLKTELEKNYRYAGLPVRVTTADPETVHTQMGMTTSYSGHLKEKNGWLVLVEWEREDIPVYNITEGVFAPNIHAIRDATPVRSYGRW